MGHSFGHHLEQARNTTQKNVQFTTTQRHNTRVFSQVRMQVSMSARSVSRDIRGRVISDSVDGLRYFGLGCR